MKVIKVYYRIEARVSRREGNQTHIEWVPASDLVGYVKLSRPLPKRGRPKTNEFDTQLDAGVALEWWRLNLPNLSFMVREITVGEFAHTMYLSQPRPPFFNR